MTDKQIKEIEAHFGGREIYDIQKTYDGFSIEMLYEIVQSSEADKERRTLEAGLIEQRQSELLTEATEHRKQAEERFKTLAKSRFLESNPIADEADFEKLYPQIRNEEMLTNYRSFAAKEVVRSAEIYN